MAHSLCRSLRLMLVDDDPAMISLLTGAVRRQFQSQFEILGTTELDEARHWLDTRAFDFLITDIEMPGGSGLDLLRYAKKADAWTQVVMITGHSTWERVTEALEAGASDYLLKPVKLDAIATILRDGCERLDRWHSAARGTLDRDTAPAVASR